MLTNGDEYNVFLNEINKFVFLDYINHELKLIIEWDESHHKYQKNADLIREKAIKNLFFDYEFKRIKNY